jgi:hypothetical protein
LAWLWPKPWLRPEKLQTPAIIGKVGQTTPY